jgi:hypothetical protein
MDPIRRQQKCGRPSTAIFLYDRKSKRTYVQCASRASLINVFFLLYLLKRKLFKGLNNFKVLICMERGSEKAA